MRATRQGANFIVVLIGLVLIFKKQLVSLVNSLMEKVTNQSNTV